jgi:hypothetical protein
MKDPLNYSIFGDDQLASVAGWFFGIDVNGITRAEIEKAIDVARGVQHPESEQGQPSDGDSDEEAYLVRILETHFGHPILSYKYYEADDNVVCIVDYGIRGGKKMSVAIDDLSPPLVEVATQEAGTSVDVSPDDPYPDMDDDELKLFAKGLGITHTHSMKRETVIDRLLALESEKLKKANSTPTVDDTP